MFRKCVLVASFCAGLLAAGAASAQHKLGEILDKGGKVMTADEVRALVSGGKLSGVMASGASFESSYAADGKLTGMISSMQGTSGTYGTWLINDKGQLCTDATVQRSGQGQKVCVFFFKVGNEYYVSQSGDDREANALRRTLSR